MKAQAHLSTRLESAVVDQSKTGSGKTAKIIKHLFLHSDHSPAIIAVPSKELQYEYMHRLMSGSCPIDLTTINQDEILKHESVAKKFIQSLPSNKTISITHEALKLINHASVNPELYANRDLYIDEAFTMMWAEEITFTRTESGEVDTFNINFQEWLNPTGVIIADDIIELRPRRSSHYFSMLDMRIVRTIENPNFKVYVTKSNWESLLAGDAVKINLYGIFDFHLLARFRTVHIASAAFTNTTMLGIAMQKAGVKFKIIGEYEKQDEKIVFHVASTDNKLYSHSKSAILNHKDRTDCFRKYVIDYIGDRECLLLRNVVDTSVVESNFTLINNNCHGINKHRHVDAISIESTYNPSNNLTAIFYKVLQFTEEQIILCMSGNTFYQCIMRTAARDKDNTKPIDVFLLDAKVFPILTKYFFSNYEVKYIDLGKIEKAERKKHKQHKQHKPREATCSSEHDLIKDFMTDYPSGVHKASLVYDSFVALTGSTISIHKFATSLEALGIKKRRTSAGNVYHVNTQ